MANPNQHARSSGTGQYVRTPETAARDARAAELRAEGRTLQQIADELGYSDKTNAQRGIRRALRDIVEGPAEKLLSIHMERLETLYDAAINVLETDHVVVSHGQIVRDDEGQPLVDSAPKLAAIREARQSLESFRKLLGMDAPSRVSVDAEQLGREITSLLDVALGPDGGHADA